MDGLLTDQQILISLLREYLPEIYKKIIEIDLPIAVLTFSWFLGIYIRCLPIECNLRVFDLFFTFGRKILFQVALAIFRINEFFILSSNDDNEIIFYIKNSLSDLHPDFLIRVCLFLSLIFLFFSIFLIFVPFNIYFHFFLCYFFIFFY